MQVDFNTRRKVDAVQAQISQLLLSDFPHLSSRTALETLSNFFKARLLILDRAMGSKDPTLISQTCISINERIYEYLPILGFLLRSTNNRNAFESYHSLLEIARALIGKNAEVIVSSEWNFSPLTYAQTISVLPNYVLIGMPSSESSNALIIPLAGHELGHSVWQNESLENKYASQVEDRTRKYLQDNWSTFHGHWPEYAGSTPSETLFQSDPAIIAVISKIVELSQRRIEETFCDAMGMHLFGESFALAFHYLLAPSFGGTRALEYPPLKTRAKNIDEFGGIDLNNFGFADYSNEFQDRNPALAPQSEFIVLAADVVAQGLAEKMFDEARQITFGKAGQFVPNDQGKESILAMFECNVPANEPTSLADILNAGWTYAQNKSGTFVAEDRSLLDWTSELVLKSVEVLEYRTRLSHA